MTDYDAFLGYDAPPPYTCGFCGCPVDGEEPECRNCGTLAGEDRDEPARCHTCDGYHVGPCAELDEGRE